MEQKQRQAPALSQATSDLPYRLCAKSHRKLKTYFYSFGGSSIMHCLCNRNRSYFMAE